jgi:hypothetical protein
MKQNIKHIWTLICSSSVIDSETNNLSVSNIIEELNIPIPQKAFEEAKKKEAQGVVIKHNFEIISRLKRERVENREDFFYRIVMINPDGNAMTSSVETNGVFEEGVSNMRIRNRFDAIPIEKRGGDYAFRIEIKNKQEEEYKCIYVAPLKIVVKTFSEQ